MFLVGIISWWYGNGWLARIKIIKERLAISADFFSIGLLVSTLFAPYRQISAGYVDGSISDKIHAFFDRLISRIIGATVRMSMIFAGLVVMFIQTIFGILVLFLWLILPTLSVIGIIMMIIGWVPQ